MFKYQQLHKGPCFLRAFPLAGALAGAQADDRAANPDAFAGTQGDVADQTIALVQQAKHRNAFGHRRDPGIRILPLSRGR